MPTPPKTTPHSDLDGVREDQRRNIDKANAAGQDSADLAEAERDTVARPPHSDDNDTTDDRTT